METNEVPLSIYPGGGFPLERVNCIDNPIAHAAGSFHYHNYYYYCLYNCLYNLWDSEFSSLTYIEKINFIFHKIGLEWVENSTQSFEQLIELIVKKIDQKKPLILLAPYNHIFYSDYYQDEVPQSSWLHAILIYRYHRKKRLLTIKEQGHYFIETPSETRSTLNCHITLPFRLFSEFFNGPLEQAEDTSFNSYRIFSVEAGNSENQKTYAHILRSFMNESKLRSNNLSHIIKDFDEAQKNNNIKVDKYLMRLNTIAQSIYLLFEIIERAEGLVDHNSDGFQKVKEIYVHFSQSVINYLRIRILKGDSISSDKLNDYLDKIESLDLLLNQYIAGVTRQIPANEAHVSVEERIKEQHSYKIINSLTGKYLEVRSVEDLSDVNEGEASDSIAQYWYFHYTDNGYYKIKNRMSNKNLDVMFYSIEENAKVGQYSDSVHHCQEWMLIKADDGHSYHIINRHSSKFLEISDSSLHQDTQLVQGSANQRNSQKWIVVEMK